MKYELTEQYFTHGKHTLRRIRALKDFADVKAGDLGGYIETEHNLSQHGNCWVYDEAMVYGNARVENDAQVREQAQVYDNARLSDNATAMGQALVCYNGVMLDDTTITDKALLMEDAQMAHRAMLAGTAVLAGYSRLVEDAVMYSGTLRDSCIAGGTSFIEIDRTIYGQCHIWGDAFITWHWKPVTIDIIEPLTFTREEEGAIRINTRTAAMSYKQFKAYAEERGYTPKQLKAVKQLYKAVKEAWNED